LYYYDQSGGLVKTVPPQGVDMSKWSTAASWSASVRTAIANNQSLTPTHRMETLYRYNTLGQVVAQHTPDAGLSKFWYDRLGRLVVSQNAKQQTEGLYSYTEYDGLGRITEVGQIKGNTVMSDAVSTDPQGLSNWLVSASGDKEQITSTVYDVEYAGFAIGGSPLRAQRLRNRVAYTRYSEGHNAADYTSDTYYSYDIHGNVDTLLQDYRKGAMNDKGQRFKKLLYKYDLISGKVNSVHYQGGKGDQWHHRYSYDAENRLVLAETSMDSVLWERDGRYAYYRHGSLGRLLIGEAGVQGVDYAYTLQGWLKGVNSTALDPVFDVGVDGQGGNYPSLNHGVARDAYSYTLHYFDGDYQNLLSWNKPFATVNASNMPAGAYKPLWNGNISSMAISLPLAPSAGGGMGSGQQQATHARLYNYRYDQLNRLTAMDAYSGLGWAYNVWSPALLQDYKERIRYDANGNILKYLRNGTTTGGKPLAMDSLNYFYYYYDNANAKKTFNPVTGVPADAKTVTNQLSFVSDNVAASNYTEDIDGQADKNYEYDAIGNLIKDVKDSISAIEWTVYGKIKKVTKTNGTVIDYTYDAGGNRISKKVLSTINNQPSTVTTWYVRDASGNVMSVYAIAGDSVRQTEVHIYGSSRLGMVKLNRNPDAALQPGEVLVSVPLLGQARKMIGERGRRVYELTNHLGNVLVTLSDKHWGVADASNSSLIDHWVSDVLSAEDYYPFGMGMPGRKVNEGYRYGFNGKEQDPEVNENYDFGARMYDARVGKWLALDPLMKKYPGESPYLFVGGNPLVYNDPDGKDRVITTLVTRYLGDGSIVVVTKVEVSKGLDTYHKTIQYGSNGKPNGYYEYRDIYETRTETYNERGELVGVGTIVVLSDRVQLLSTNDLSTTSGRVMERVFGVMKRVFPSEKNRGGIVCTSKYGGNSMSKPVPFPDGQPENIDILISAAKSVEYAGTIESFAHLVKEIGEAHKKLEKVAVAVEIVKQIAQSVVIAKKSEEAIKKISNKGVRKGGQTNAFDSIKVGTVVHPRNFPPGSNIKVLGKGLGETSTSPATDTIEAIH
jgi:RHS repeat-associated protein